MVTFYHCNIWGWNVYSSGPEANLPTEAAEQVPTTVEGADPGEVKWVNFHPPFSEHLLSFFSYPSNIDLKHLNQALVLLYYYKNSPPISKSWIRA